MKYYGILILVIFCFNFPIIFLALSTSCSATFGQLAVFKATFRTFGNYNIQKLALFWHYYKNSKDAVFILCNSKENWTWKASVFYLGWDSTCQFDNGHDDDDDDDDDGDNDDDDDDEDDDDGDSDDDDD